jgi:cobalt-zinc-cadmium resistance protein CzcA
VGEIYRYVVETTENHTPMELRTLQDWVIMPKLLGIPGIADVITFGGLMKQYHVITDPEKLIQYKLTLANVIDSIQANNLNTGGNILRQGEIGFPIRSLGAIRTIKDIETIVLKENNGVPIFVRDIGTVEEYPSLPTGALGYTFQDYKDGLGDIDVDSSVQGLVAMRRWGDTEEMGQKIRDKVAEINEKYINWSQSIIQNIMYGDTENEITLFKNTPLKLIKIEYKNQTLDYNVDINTSYKEVNPKYFNNIIFYA